VLDTRKTAPGLRVLDKYAVAVAGATNHRRDLAAMVLLKENHVAAAGGITAAVEAVRQGMAAEDRDLLVDVEVETVAQAEEALRAGASWLMLDNMPAADMRRVVELRSALAGDRPVTLEASGNVTLDTVRAIAGTGVDAVSVGALTHSVRALDLTLLLRRP
jgi:nicotinate-nucleotide pyrophosphorylase (carboxylating)